MGLRSYIRDGASFVRLLKDRGYRIFLDLKLYDIPNTMVDSVGECERLGVDLVTVHASCGLQALRAIASATRRVKIVAVLALTSFDEEGFEAVYGARIDQVSRRLVTLVYASGISGVVCSVHEVGLVKETSTSLMAVTPGLRLDSRADDQRRVATLQEAKKAGSDIAVVGRPVYAARDRGAALNALLDCL